MRVKNLIAILQGQDPEAKVLIPNTCIFEDGYYSVDAIGEYCNEGYVTLESDYKTEYSDVI